MTAAQLHDARMLIPGAFEPNAPPHRATHAAGPVPAAPWQDVRSHPADAAIPYVLAAPDHPTTRRGHAAAILRDVALVTGIILSVTLVPGLAVRGVITATALILEKFGR